MASYPTQILDAPPQYGFLPGLASGIASGGEKFSNLYAESMMKDMFAKREAKKKQEAINAFQAAMRNDQTMEMDQVSMDESGNPKWTYKKKKTPESAYEKDPMKMIKQAMGGILPGAQMEQLGQAQGIAPQQPMDRNYASLINQAILNPAQTSIAPAPRGVMDMVNLPTKPVYDPQLAGPMNAQGGRFMEYPDVVRQENLKKFAPGFTEEQVKRDVMGLPAETPAEKMAAEQAKIPKLFKDDVQKLKSIAKGDAEVFVAGLERLVLKYTDNQDVLDRIKLIRSIFSGQEPVEFKPDLTLQ